MHRLKSGRLAVGQILLIPTPAVAAASLVVPDPAIEKFPNSTARLKVHTVRRGETIGGIARKYGTSTERLMRINGLRKPVIFPGQTLLLSGNVSRSSKAAKARVAAIRAENAKRGCVPLDEEGAATPAGEVVRCRRSRPPKAFGRRLESRRPNEEQERAELRARRMTSQVTP